MYFIINSDDHAVEIDADNLEKELDEVIKDERFIKKVEAGYFDSKSLKEKIEKASNLFVYVVKLYTPVA